jgi:hypothetical protein
MGRVYWQCPITAENLQARVQSGEAFQLHLAAAAREALQVLYGPEGEALYWEARREAAKGDSKAAKREQEYAQAARRFIAGVQ